VGRGWGGGGGGGGGGVTGGGGGGGGLWGGGGGGGGVGGGFLTCVESPVLAHGSKLSSSILRGDPGAFKGEEDAESGGLMHKQPFLT